MPNTPRVITNVINLTDVPSTPVGGLHFVAGPTQRGPYAQPDTIINSWAAFQRLYGGLLDATEFPMLCKRALDKGANLRVSRVGHYTDPQDAGTLESIIADKTTNQVFVFTGLFGSGNTFNVTLNGSAITQVNYTTDHGTTMDAIVTELALHPAVTSASVMDGGQAIQMVASSPITVTALSVTGPSVSVIDEPAFINTKGEVLFKVRPIAEGGGYNGMTLSFVRNGKSSTSFQVQVEVGGVSESFPLILSGKVESGSLMLDGDGTLQAIADSSNLIEIYDINTAAPFSQIDGVAANHVFAGGSFSMGNIVEGDYIGDSGAGTGIQAFNPYNDGTTLSVPTEYGTNIHIAGAAYSSNRRDLVYLAELNPFLTTATAIEAARDTLVGLNQYTMLFAGGLKFRHPDTGATQTSGGLGDILANISNNHVNVGPWSSFANQRGIINNAVGVHADFGSPALYDERNQLANAQVNLLITKSGQILQWGNFTAQTTQNSESYANVVFTIIYLKKLLEPTLEAFLEEPTDIPTFKRMHLTVQPTLDSLVGQAYTSYRWEGDQDASSIEDVQVNQPSDLAQGKYTINFYIKPIIPIQEIKVNITLTSAGISFEEL